MSERRKKERAKARRDARQPQPASPVRTVTNPERDYIAAGSPLRMEHARRKVAHALQGVVHTKITPLPNRNRVPVDTVAEKISAKPPEVVRAEQRAKLPPKTPLRMEKKQQCHKRPSDTRSKGGNSKRWAGKYCT